MRSNRSVAARCGIVRTQNGVIRIVPVVLVLPAAPVLPAVPAVPLALPDPAPYLSDTPGWRKTHASPYPARR